MSSDFVSTVDDGEAITVGEATSGVGESFCLCDSVVLVECPLHGVKILVEIILNPHKAKGFLDQAVDRLLVAEDEDELEVAEAEAYVRRNVYDASLVGLRRLMLKLSQRSYCSMFSFERVALESRLVAALEYREYLLSFSLLHVESENLFRNLADEAVYGFELAELGYGLFMRELHALPAGTFVALKTLQGAFLFSSVRSSAWAVWDSSGVEGDFSELDLVGFNHFDANNVCEVFVFPSGFVFDSVAFLGGRSVVEPVGWGHKDFSRYGRVVVAGDGFLYEFEGRRVKGSLSNEIREGEVKGLFPRIDYVNSEVSPEWFTLG